MRNALGGAGEAGGVRDELARLHDARASAARPWRTRSTLAAEAVRQRRTAPTSSGRDPRCQASTHATRVACSRSLSAARRRRCGSAPYTYYDGPKAFELLARRMDAGARPADHAAAQHPARAGRHLAAATSSSGGSPTRCGATAGPERADRTSSTTRGRCSPTATRPSFTPRPSSPTTRRRSSPRRTSPRRPSTRTSRSAALARPDALATSLSKHFRVLIERELLVPLPSA